MDAGFVGKQVSSGHNGGGTDSDWPANVAHKPENWEHTGGGRGCCGQTPETAAATDEDSDGRRGSWARTGA